MLESIEVPVTNGKKDGNQNFMTRNDLPGKFPGSKNCHNCHQAAFYMNFSSIVHMLVSCYS